MDRLLINMVEDTPPITRYWVLGILVVSILLKIKIMDFSSTVYYSYELCFKRKQYYRLFFSFFSYGDFSLPTIINLYLSVSHLSALESNLMINKTKFIILVGFLLVIVIGMSKTFPIVGTVGMLMHENLVYYRNKCTTFQGNNDAVNANGWFLMDPMLVTLVSNLMLYLEHGLQWKSILLTFIPGHLAFFIEKVIYRLYKKPIKKSLRKVQRMVGI